MSENTAPPPKAPLLIRIVLGIAGLGLLFGFFLPWIKLGNMVALSGLTLSLSGGAAVDALTGPYRFMIFSVPFAGALLMFAAARGLRAIAWIGLLSGFAIMGTGLFTLVTVFLDSTGLGMWIVALSSMLAVTVGLATTRGK